MSRKLLALFLLPLLLTTAVFTFALQDQPPTLEIFGVNGSNLPTVVVNANVTDPFGQPVSGLTVDDFNLLGTLEDIGTIVSVENITDDNLPFAVVLTIDTSESMTGTPLVAAKEAAQLFVEGLRPEDSVSIVEFNSQARVVLDYTTDKQAVLAAIDELQAGGRTALYDAGLLSVDQAAAAPLARRVVVFLSDGAEFEDGRSRAARGAALESALEQGVPVYTVGLGFGTDRTYLQSLANETNGRFIEAPSPQQLSTIYSDLGNLLRSQYIITLDIPVAADGTQYEFGLEALTDLGDAQAFATLNTPVPVPIVSFIGVPDGAIDSPLSIGAITLADDDLESVSASFDDGAFVPVEGEDLSLVNVLIDPITFTPGPHTLTVRTQDVDGDIGEATLPFEIAALAPLLDVTTEITDDNMLMVTANTVGSQTPVTNAEVTLDGADTLTMTTEDGALFNAAYPLIDYSVGPSEVSVTASNDAGLSTTDTVSVDIPAVPPQATLSLEPGTTLEGDTVVTYDIVAQAEPVTVTFQFDGGDFVIAAGEIPVNVVPLGAGDHILTVNVTDANGSLQTLVVPFIVSEAAIPTPTPIPTLTPTHTPTTPPTATFTPTDEPTPTMAPTEVAALPAENAVQEFVLIDAVNDVALGPLVEGDVVDLSTLGTTAINIEAVADDALDVDEGSVVFELSSSQEALVQTDSEAPFTLFEDDAGMLGADAYTLDVSVFSESSGEGDLIGTDSISFVFTGDLADNALATPTMVPTMTPEPTEVNLRGTAIAEAEATLSVQADQTATAGAEATFNAEATAAMSINLTEQAELDANATATVQAGLDADATATAQAAEDANNARSTAIAEAQATVLAGAEQTASAADALATQNAFATLTAEADLQATENAARGTAIAEAQATVLAGAEATSTASGLAAINAGATQDAQATLDAEAAADAEATAGIEATRDAQATANVEATADAEATEAALPTINAIASETAAVEETADAEATSDAEATADMSINLTEQAELDADATAAADVTATPTGGPRDVPSATPVGTPENVDIPPGSQTIFNQIPPWIYATCGVSLFVIIILLIVLGSRFGGNDRSNRRR